MISRVLGVSDVAVLKWVRAEAASLPEPVVSPSVVTVEVDEMWHFLKKRPTSSGSGRLGIVLQGEWLTGNAAVVTPPP